MTIESAALKSIENLTLGYVVTNADNKVLLMNYAAAKLFAGPKTFSQLEQVADELPKRVDLMMHVTYCSREHKSCSFREVELGDKTVKVFLSPLFDGEAFSGNVVTFEDITETITNQHARDQFLSSLVHEFRTPLTAMSGNAYLAKAMLQDIPKNTDLSEVVDDMSAGTKNLLGMVNQFLDMSRLEEGRITFNLKQCNPLEIAHTTVDSLKVLASAKKLALNIDAQSFDDQTVVGDPDRIGQILTNLVGNAIKYTESGKITVSTKTHDEQIEILVSDTGTGIPADSRKGLFQKYFQASNNKLKADSSKSLGLGLYTARLMAEGMGGNLDLAEQGADTGSVFSLKLNIATPQQLKLMEKQIYDTQHGVKHEQAAEHNMIVMR